MGVPSLFQSPNNGTLPLKNGLKPPGPFPWILNPCSSRVKSNQITKKQEDVAKHAREMKEKRKLKETSKLRVR